jgi:gas vesicle protein
MRRNDEQRNENEEYFEQQIQPSRKTSDKLTYLLVGGGIGAVLALLFAPKSGTELRTDITDATRKGVDRTREGANQLGQKSNQYLSNAKQKAGDIYSRAGGALNAAKGGFGKQSGAENEQASNQLTGNDFGKTGNVSSSRDDSEDLPIA